jgi:Putative DNA-binding domain
VSGLPYELEEWTLDTIKHLLEHHAYEPGFFDFKEALSNKADPHLAANVAKSVCSMANADGGYLIFGVRDRGATSGEGYEARLVGIPIGEDHAKEFGQKIAGCIPAIHFATVPRPIPLESDPLRGIFVVRIPRSERRPHMEARQGIFYIRGDGGSARPMDYYEVRDQMILTEERLQQVRLLRLKLAQLRNQCREVKALDLEGLRMSYSRLETGAFEALLATITPLLIWDQDLPLQLLKIPTAAQAINRRLDRYLIDDYYGHRLKDDGDEAAKWQGQIRHEAGLLGASCAECEDRLRTQFGPLIG